MQIYKNEYENVKTDLDNQTLKEANQHKTTACYVSGAMLALECINDQPETGTPSTDWMILR